MKITNIHNLPKSIFNALTANTYHGPKNQEDHLSVTTIINPVQQHVLKCRHHEEVEEDASERLWSLLGSACHYVLEHGEDATTIKEERLEEVVDGVKLSGQMDLLGQDSIEDYKVTSVYSYIYSPNGKPEWVKQLNIYRWLSRKIFDIKRLTINMILRDHQGSKAKQDPAYPQIPFKSIDLEVWPLEKTEAYIKERIAAFKASAALPDNQLPPCTDEEMWAKETTWAIMKEGRKTALKVCYSLAEAQANQTPGTTIVTRPGARTRCEDYCSVNKFCAQYAAYKGAA
jgi:hypothetical protein